MYFQAFKVALFFLLFPTFLICSYFSLLFHENALLSLLFYSKMSFTRKNLEIFPRSLRSLRFYKLTSMFIQGEWRLTPQFLLFNLIVSLNAWYYCHRYYPAHLIWNYLFQTAHCNEFYIWKSPTIPTFLRRYSLLFHYFFQIFIPTFSLLFCWWALESLIFQHLNRFHLIRKYQIGLTVWSYLTDCVAYWSIVCSSSPKIVIGF